MKIAIYSGSIPSTTFIENLIDGLASEQCILIFGTLNRKVTYKSSNIKVYGNSKIKINGLAVLLYRALSLLILYPNRFIILVKEVKKYAGWYKKWRALTRIVPVILHKPDIFHVQWAKDISQWSFLSEKFSIKLVLSLRGAHINYSPIADPELAKTYNRIFPQVDRFHAVSNAIALEAQKYNAPNEKIMVIHSPIPSETFGNFKLLKKSNKNKINIVSVGRFHWKKGYKYAIDAVKHLKDEGINVHYTVIAANAISEDILFQIHQLELVDEVTIMNGLSQNELFKEVQRFDALVLPSLEEGIANVVLEAMALGVPVISTDCGGMAEVVIPKETGWLVPVRDSHALAVAIDEVNETSELELQELTKRAHEYVKTYFNAEDSIRKFLDLYIEVLYSN